MKILFTILLLLFFQNAFSELRLGLTKKQYKNLEPLFSKNSSQRFDLYLEAFDGKHFLLEEKGIKFRLKNDEKKTIVQISKQVDTKYLKCGPHTISWKKRRKFRSKNEKLIRLLTFKGTEIFKYLHSRDKLPKELIHDFDSKIRELNFKGKEFLLKSLSGEGPYLFIPSHTNKKYRRKIKIGEGKNFKLILGKTLEKGSQNHFITFYEIEGEMSKAELETQKEYLNLFCQKIKGLKISSEKIEGKKEKKINLKAYKNKMPSLFK